MSHGNLSYTSTDHVNALKQNISLNMKYFEPNVNTAVNGPERMAKMQADLKSLDNYPKFQDGGIIDDDMGQWKHPGKVTRINSNNITMQGVNYPVLGVSDTGDVQMMYPGEDYKFKGKKVTEYPIVQNGKKISNFTKNNRTQSGGWLDDLR